ncbi:tRNA-uridine aminocarboxypropyltransferase [Rugamonas aquatica]|uniref:tRNA-uridine aminocarboxypropyltransferase n=1 Tax=Rugamonas aquatica TaxID=2743357 RepID=A0A6A7N312_9BURK|nr:tRNA-uridine aminocarboxypropyltransferase [Rugamonas aquatica]MQA39494.1 DTW domain-containing protein [Rugamonas aquatica]
MTTAASSTPPTPRSTRAHCAACLRPQQTCICRWVAALPNQVEVLILQHPMEVNNAKGSARLLHLSLSSSRLEVGEAFAPERLQELLSPERRSVLLYPDTVEDKSLGLAAAQPFDAEWLQAPQDLRLVVLDGTWRKSRKMLYLNPALQSLPRLPLRDTPPSHYLIRKAHLPDQLSTLEATVYALAQLENDINKFNPLIDAFDGFVAQQAGYVARPPSGDQL